MSPVEQAKLGIFTASRLQREQFVGIVERKIRQTVLPRLPFDFDARYERQIPAEPCASLSPLCRNTATLRGCLDADTRRSHRTDLERFESNRIEFLGHDVSLDTDRTIAWDDDQLSDVPLLWWLKFQSLEPLEWFVFGDEKPARSDELVVKVLDPWLRAMASTTTIGAPEYLRRDWIPHAVSLRVMNLSRYCAWLDEHEMLADRQFALEFLYKNALFLRNHVERDVGGNHLIENALALLMAGLVFEQDHSWAELGTELFEETATSQFLGDGGHFERSPMYHIMVLTRFLTAADLLAEYGHPIPPEVERTARRATQFIDGLTPPDGRIPLLNDSQFDEVLSIAEVTAYATAVGVSATSDSPALESSGYYWLGSGVDRMLVDGGPVGPPHLPGHSHVDLLSILLWLDGQRVLTDTGVYQYTADTRRQYARGIRSHNSVQVGDSNPITVGGQYLLGRRTEPKISVRRDRSFEAVEGRYSTPRGPGPSYTHARRILTDEEMWVVVDRVSKAGDAPTTSRLHFHPSITVERRTEGRFQISTESGESLGEIRLVNCADCVLKSSPYFPEFGTEITRTALEIDYGTTPAGYVISTDKLGEVEYRSDQGVLTVAGESFDLSDLDSVG